MTPSSAPCRRPRFAGALASFLIAAATAGAASHPLLDRWELTLPNGAAGWLELRSAGGWYDGSLLWGGGSVVPVSHVVLDGDTAIITRVREVERKDAQGKVLRKQQVTETLTATANGDVLHLTRSAPKGDSGGFDRSEFSGRRAAPLPPRPDLSRIRYGAPITLLNANDLGGWRLIESQAENGWTVRAGVLDNRPIEALPGQPRRRFGNLRTEREFEDFRLTLDVNVPKGSNSGVYLRGIYEVQVLDSHGKAVDAHNMGAIYSRITPLISAEKPAGDWQSLDITLVDRHVTVILNNRTIIDNQPLAGVTGGALWSDPLRPGPIYLQGDHGPVSYRNFVIRPVLK
jgi:hypothetical protein